MAGAVPGNRFSHRAAADLVPEAQRRPLGDQQAGFGQLVNRVRRGVRGPLEQPRLDRPADQRGDVEHATRSVRHHEITEVREKLEVAPAGISGEAVLQQRLHLRPDIPSDPGLFHPGN